MGVPFAMALDFKPSARGGCDPCAQGRSKHQPVSMHYTPHMERFLGETRSRLARVHQAVRKLRIKSVPHNSVKAIRKENRRDPGPQRGRGTWDNFLKIHAATLWQCDFFSTKFLTPKGLRDIFVLVFLHVETRRLADGGDDWRTLVTRQRRLSRLRTP